VQRKRSDCSVAGAWALKRAQSAFYTLDAVFRGWSIDLCLPFSRQKFI